MAADGTLIGLTVTHGGNVETIVAAVQNDDGTLEIDTQDQQGRRWHYSKCSPTAFSPSVPGMTEMEVEFV